MFSQKVQEMATAAHWAFPQADASGIFRFSLEAEAGSSRSETGSTLEFSLFSPDARTAIVCGLVLVVPSKPQSRDALLAHIAATQAGIAAQRASVVAYEPAGQGVQADGVQADGVQDSIVIYRSFPVQDTDFSGQVREFLNDFVWWKGACAAFSEGQSVSGAVVSPAALLMGSVY